MIMNRCAGNQSGVAVTPIHVTLNGTLPWGAIAYTDCNLLQHIEYNIAEKKEITIAKGTALFLSFPYGTGNNVVFFCNGGTPKLTFSGNNGTNVYTTTFLDGDAELRQYID